MRACPCLLQDPKVLSSACSSFGPEGLHVLPCVHSHPFVRVQATSILTLVTPLSRASARTCQCPDLVPSSWCLATSTVSSARWSAGLLHPAAGHGVGHISHLDAGCPRTPFSSAPCDLRPFEAFPSSAAGPCHHVPLPSCRSARSQSRTRRSATRSSKRACALVPNHRSGLRLEPPLLSHRGVPSRHPGPKTLLPRRKVHQAPVLARSIAASLWGRAPRRTEVHRVHSIRSCPSDGMSRLSNRGPSMLVPLPASCASKCVRCGCRPRPSLRRVRSTDLTIAPAEAGSCLAGCRRVMRLACTERLL